MLYFGAESNGLIVRFEIQCSGLISIVVFFLIFGCGLLFD